MRGSKILIVEWKKGEREVSKKCRSVSAKASLPSPSLIVHDLHAKKPLTGCGTIYFPQWTTKGQKIGLASLRNGSVMLSHRS